MGPLWDHYGDHYGTTMGPLWDHYGTTMGPLWDHYGNESHQALHSVLIPGDQYGGPDKL